MVYKISFGTDGWRGKIAQEFTFENVERAAQGYALFLNNKNLGHKGIIIGYDRRFHSKSFAYACAEVLVGNNIPVWITKRETPTPVISYSVLDKKAAGAINITASHNPPEDNGFKVRDDRGAAVPPSELKIIEELIPKSNSCVKKVDFETALKSGRITIFDPDKAYINHLNDIIDLDALKNANKTIICDPMYGNASGWYERLLGGGNNKIIEIHKERNPIFPEIERPEPIHPNIDVGLQKTVELNGDVLFINDGDSDRQGIGDEKGNYIDQLRLASLLAFYLLEFKKVNGPIIKTVNMSSMLDKLAEQYNIPVYETPVGFKHVADLFIKKDAIMGCEESGGYSFINNTPERDGILGNLLFLEFMVRTGKTPSQLVDMLFEKVGNRYYYKRIDVKCSAEEKEEAIKSLQKKKPLELAGYKVENINTLDGFKYNLGEFGWVIIRISGTESLLRVYCETNNIEAVDDLLQEGLKLAGIKKM